MNKGIVIAAALSCGALQLNAQELMTPELLWKLGRVSAETVTPDKNELIYGVTYYKVEENKGNRDLYAVDLKSGETRQITNTEGSEYGVQYHPDGTMGYMHGGNWNEVRDGKVVAVSGLEGVSFVKYSPKGDKVLFVKEVKVGKTIQDQYSDVPEANVLKYDDLMVRHWDHWEDENRSHVFIADYKDGMVSNAIDLMEKGNFDSPMQPFGGSEDVIWNPDGSQILYVCKKEEGANYATSTNSEIYIYDVNSKNTSRLPHNREGYDTHPMYSPDGKYIAWLGMNTMGYESDKNVLYIADQSGENLIYNSSEWDNTINSFIWSEDGEDLIISAGTNATYQLYKLEATPFLEGKSKEQPQITVFTEGTHNIGGPVAEVNGKVIASKMDMNHAAELYSFSYKNGKEEVLTHVNDSIYATLKTSEVKEMWVETTDGKKMLVWVILPPDFDPNKKYPSIFYCQGGPQSAVSQFYSFRWNFQLMAANGYVVIAPNRRGLPTFGHEWNHAISKDWGGMAMEDYKTAYDGVLSTETYIDPARVGCVGASYGGYSVYMLAGIHEDRFASFISHCGLFDLPSWYGTTEELFFANYDIGGPYWMAQNQEGYVKNSPHTYVANWNRPIMVIHGEKDYRVPINQGLEAFTAAKLLGLDSRLLVFPDEGHWVLQPQNGLVWHREFFDWLDLTVKNIQ